MPEQLIAQRRDTRGSRRARRQRAAGSIPAVIYGHGKETISLSIPAEQMLAALRHGGHLVDLGGDVTESALIRAVQWDALGAHVLHVDFTRVEAGEVVEITLRVELKGTAPGTREGGVVEQLQHEIEIECPVVSIPDKLTLNINALMLGSEIRAKDVPLPEGAKLLIDPETIVVECHEPMAELEEAAAPAAAEAAEPEVIGRKAEEEGEEAEGE
jgi:large subunit ribosomal protein L25